MNKEIINIEELKKDFLDKESFFSSYIKELSLTHNKTLKITIQESDRLFVVSRSHLMIGLVFIKTRDDGNTEISLYSFPRICRVSVLSLIEASVYIAKRVNAILPLFKDIPYYVFKYKIIFKNFTNFVDFKEDSVEVRDFSVLKEITEEEISIKAFNYESYKT